ncbi:MAG: glycosyltransferase family 4 protein, partial [Armatimonadetes bacterium]|nr:glycosyltransferase family 4 protein [Armatimonadota bacterium]
MRIVQVLAGLAAGGAERLVLNLSRWLQQQGHEVVVVNIYRNTTLQPDFERAGIQVHQLQLTPVVSQWYPLALVRFLAQFGAEVVHCHDTAWRKTAQACRWTGLPCVWTLHGYLQEWLLAGRGWMQQAARHTAYLVGVEPKV